MPFCFNLEPRPQGKSDKLLSDDSLEIIMTCNEGITASKNIARLMILTGCRHREITSLEYSDIDMKAMTITVRPEHIKTERAYKKMDKPHVIPLLPKMSAIILEQRQFGAKGLIFKKTNSSKSKIEFYQPSATGRWLTSVGISGGTHQIRRTVATRLSEHQGITDTDVRIILNHAIGGATGKYVISQHLDRKREVLTLWHSMIDDIMVKDAKIAL